MASFVFRRLIWKYIGKSYLPLTKNRIIIMHFIVKMTYFFGFLIHVNSVFRIISKSSIIFPPNVYFNLPLLWLQMCFILPHRFGQDEHSPFEEKSHFIYGKLLEDTLDILFPCCWINSLTPWRILSQYDEWEGVYGRISNKVFHLAPHYPTCTWIKLCLLYL